jgi:thiol-disulfide isomerase/thioredoxin
LRSHFFTSSTCAPCKIVYPAYDELAAEAGNQAVLIKVDLNQAYDVSAKYGVRATPTFMTFLKGEKENEWSGANESQLRGNVRMLIQMAHPPHPHINLKLPKLQSANLKPVTYTKMPPLDKLITKMGDTGKLATVKDVENFIVQRETSGAREAPYQTLQPSAPLSAHPPPFYLPN